MERRGEAARSPSRRCRSIDGDRAAAIPTSTVVNESKTVEYALAAGEVQLVAGTAWLFARPGMEEPLDHLVVDEAGQMSLANVVAVGTATREPRAGRRSAAARQPIDGLASRTASACRRARARPRRSADRRRRTAVCSSSTTYRMHPDICEFVSGARRTRTASLLGRTAVGSGSSATARSAGSGLRWIPVEHTGNKLSSDEEAAAVARCYESLIGRRLDRRQRRRVGRSRSRTSSSSRRTTPRSQRSVACCPTARESAPSTSSRVRRRRS